MSIGRNISIHRVGKHSNLKSVGDNKLSRPINKRESIINRIAKKILQFKKYLKGGDTETHRHVASGADKRVYIPRNQVERTSKAFYAPVVKLYGIVNKTKTLREEVKKMGQMKKDITAAGGSTDHLALDAVELEDENRILGKYTVEVEAADGDYEKFLNDSSLTSSQRKDLARQYLEGMSELNKAGYASGDVKPENCLIYRNPQDDSLLLKISDFGKAKKVGAESKTYKGNLRFAPPEGTLSTKGDAWGAALVMIRTFEEPLLESEEKSLINIIEKDKDNPSTKGRRGVENFTVEHKSFLGLDEPTLKDKVFKRLPRQARLKKLPLKQKIAQQEAIHGYIDKMIEKLQQKEEIPVKKSELSDFGILLKEMTMQDPDKRISTQEALEKYKKVFTT